MIAHSWPRLYRQPLNHNGMPGQLPGTETFWQATLKHPFRNPPVAYEGTTDAPSPATGIHRVSRITLGFTEMPSRSRYGVQNDSHYRGQESSTVFGIYQRRCLGDVPMRALFPQKGPGAATTAAP